MSTSNNLFQAHNQWATRPADQRFQTLAALRDAVHGRRMRARSQDAELRNVKITAGDAGEIFVNGQTTQASPTNWAFGQLATALKAPAGYLRNIPAPLAAQCLMHGVESAPTDALKFMSLANEDGTRTLQAITSTSYGRIWDADVVDAAGRIVERTGGRFYNPSAYATPGQLGGETVPSGLYASDRDVFIFMIDGGSLLDVGNRAKLNRGFFLWNSEVGSRTFGLTTFLFNVVCGNHIVWGAQDVNTLVVRHTKNGPARFDAEAVPALLRYVDASAKPVEDAIKRALNYNIAQEIGLPASTELTQEHVQMFVATRTAGAKFTRDEIKGAVECALKEEGQCVTLWDLSQGFTAYARGYDFLDARTNLETRAGKLLDLVKA